MYGHPLLTSLDTLLQRTVPANRVAVPDNTRLSLDWMRKSDERMRNRMPGVDNAFDVATLPEEHRGTLNQADMDAGELVKMMLLLGGGGGPTERGPGIPYAKPFVSACERNLNGADRGSLRVCRCVDRCRRQSGGADTVLRTRALFGAGMQPCVRTRSAYRLIVDRRALIDPRGGAARPRQDLPHVGGGVLVDAAGMTRAWSAVADLHAQRARAEGRTACATRQVATGCGRVCAQLGRRGLV